MAAEVSSMPGVNGFAPHQGYGSLEQNNAFSSTPASNHSSDPPPPAQEIGSSASGQSEIPKDEVGWYFVEQYYTTLSRSPEKLYLFYNKRSQFVSGQETDKVPVCVGQRAINDRIKELDFHDCKVRVTNVDSQASDSNIVIQVIGEISNKGHPHKKFTQTFVLATQTNGYFVLNDIFRYLIEEEDEEQEQAPQSEEVQQTSAAESGYKEPAPTANAGSAEVLTSSNDPTVVENDAKEVDKELEEKVLKTEEPPVATTNGAPEEEEAVVEQQHEEAEEEAPAPAAPADAPAEEPLTSEVERTDTAEESLQPEKPQDPSPSPAPTPAAQAPPPQQPAALAKAAAPKTWASLAASAAGKVATPATPAAPQQPAQQRNAPAPKPQSSSSGASATPAAPAAPSAPAASREETATPTSSQDEWNTVTGSHNRSQSRHVDQQQQGPKSRGFIKNVHEGIKHEELEAHLKSFGEVTYLDISRPKNCAFVDWKTPQAYQAAVSANPHTIGDTQLYVEERHMRPGSTPYIPRGGSYGGRGGRGGQGQGAPRGDFGGGRGRGQFNGPPRGGRGGAPRGARGGAATQA